MADEPSSVEDRLNMNGSTDDTTQPLIEETSIKPPSLNASRNPLSLTTSPSNPLAAVNNARRPGGLSVDMAAKMKQFAANRANAPRPNVGTQSPFVGTVPSGGFVGTPVTGQPPRFGSPTAGKAKGPMGGLKRGPKLNLADAVKKDENGSAGPAVDTGSQFKQYEKIVDSKTGTLNFKDKAVVHAGGIDFSNGTTFSISLDEVDTLEELGKGNYGTVFKVRHSRPKMRRPGQGLRGNMQRGIPVPSKFDDGQASAGTTGLVMAMKEIRLELDDSKFAQIIMELDVLHRCVSPFIIDFYGAFFQEGSVYICLENMDGGSIDKLYGDGVPEGVLRKITLSTVMGLRYLKDEHNIIHRDVKPTNILVNTMGQVKICDFGVSGNLVASMARTNIGCQSYMAPERISGGGMSAGSTSSGAYSVQSDIWSLALTIIECALGRYPYPPETYNNIFSQLSAIVDGEPPGLPATGYSDAARDFVKGCLNKIPGKRPTYAMLLRHAWLAPLMKPPTIEEDEEAEKAAEAGGEASGVMAPRSLVTDKEVATWVREAMERKQAGKMSFGEKPALHSAPLDQVPADLPAPDDVDLDSITSNPGVKVESPELLAAKINSLDFA